MKRFHTEFSRLYLIRRNDKSASLLRFHRVEICLLKRNPAVKEALGHLPAVARENAGALQFGRDRKADGNVVQRRQFGMEAVCLLYTSMASGAKRTAAPKAEQQTGASARKAPAPKKKNAHPMSKKAKERRARQIRRTTIGALCAVIAVVLAVIGIRAGSRLVLSLIHIYYGFFKSHALRFFVSKIKKPSVLSKAFAGAVDGT